MALTIINGPTIASGTSLSPSVDCASGLLVYIMMPASWTNAPLSFEVSNDNVTFAPLYNYEGQEIAINVKAGGAALVPVEWRFKFIKFRSGMLASAVPQGANRTFSVAVLT